jgi:hypothetical protein
MNTEKAIATIAAAVGLPDIRLDVNNTCNLVIDDKFEVYFTGDPLGAQLRMQGVLGDYAEFEPDPKALLASNAVALETGSGALALDAITGEVLYVQTLDLSTMQDEALLSALTDFLKYTAFWEGQLPDMRAAAIADDPAGSEDVTFRL